VTDARRLGAVAILSAVVGLSGCTAPEPQAMISVGTRIDAPDFLHSVRGAAGADGAVARATDDELVGAGVRLCHPIEGDADAGVSIGDVVISDRDDLDALLRAARLYLCP
jgi:hypothetical protein